MYTNLYNICETTNDITINKESIPNELWYFLFPVCALVVIFTTFIILSFFSFNHYTVIAVIFELILLAIIPALYIRWNYYSNYPARTYISKGNIVIEFRHLFEGNKIINVSLEDHPTLVGDTIQRYDSKSPRNYSRVRLEMTSSLPINIYFQWGSSENETLFLAKQLAKKISNLTGFFLRN
jgi:hypothetical protein